MRIAGNASPRRWDVRPPTWLSRIRAMFSTAGHVSQPRLASGSRLGAAPVYASAAESSGRRRGREEQPRRRTRIVPGGRADGWPWRSVFPMSPATLRHASDTLVAPTLSARSTARSADFRRPSFPVLTASDSCLGWRPISSSASPARVMPTPERPPTLDDTLTHERNRRSRQRVFRHRRQAGRHGEGNGC